MKLCYHLLAEFWVCLESRGDQQYIPKSMIRAYMSTDFNCRGNDLSFCTTVLILAIGPAFNMTFARLTVFYGQFVMIWLG